MLIRPFRLRPPTRVSLHLPSPRQEITSPSRSWEIAFGGVLPVDGAAAGGDELGGLAAADGEAHRQHAVQPQGGHGVVEHLPLYAAPAPGAGTGGQILHLEPDPAGAFKSCPAGSPPPWGAPADRRCPPHQDVPTVSRRMPIPIRAPSRSRWVRWSPGTTGSAGRSGSLRAPEIPLPASPAGKPAPGARPPGSPPKPHTGDAPQR